MTNKSNLNYRNLKSWKYQITKPYKMSTGIKPKKAHEGEFITLSSRGVLTLSKYYAWDGATGFRDIDTIMEASLVHDAFCQLMEEGVLPRDNYRFLADQLLQKQCVDNGMSNWLAKIVYGAVRGYSKFKYGV